VIFSLPQDELPDILASASNGKLPVIAYTRDGSRSLAEGDLSVVDSQVDSATGQVRLRAIFANTIRTPWPGSLGQARIAPGTHVEAKKEAGGRQPGGASQAGSGLQGNGRIAPRAHLS
jgi:multidrug efflux pump subunit AcrA (membrane-fusion protein)